MAIAQDGVCSHVLVFEETKHLSARLFSSLKTLLASEEAIDSIAAGIGPGSFVGTRTGLILAKSLSFAWDLPLLSFYSPLAFIPRQGLESFAYVGDAKMGRLFVLEAQENEPYEDISPPRLMALEELSPLLAKKSLILSDKPLGLGESVPSLSLEPLAQHVHKEFLKEGARHPTQLPMAYI